MNKALKTIFLIGIFVLISSCQDRKNSDSNSIAELPNEFFQRWELDYVLVDGQKTTWSHKSPDYDIEFKRNGKYLFYNEDKTFTTGKWEYYNSERIILTSDDGGSKSEITEVTTESLSLVPSNEDIKGMIYEKYRFHYVPKME